MTHFRKIIFKNGLRLILAPQRSGLAASVLILVEAGSEYEKKEINGLSHFLEHMMFKGTTNRPRVGQIAEELAALGAQSNAFTTQEFTGYWAKAEARKLPKILDIVSDLYLNPLFVPEEIEKERGVIIEELNMYEDTPMRKVQDIFLSLMYGDQPAGWDVGGTKEVIRKLAREDFVAYRGERYVMPGTAVVVAGSFNEKAVIQQVQKAFANLKRRPVQGKPKTREHQKKPALLLKLKESDQGHLVLGFRAFDIFDKRRYALQALADVLGGGMSSRLWKRVRDELGAAYYVHADAELSLDHGVFGISAGVDHAKIQTVIQAVLEECRKLRDEAVPEKELQRSKDHLIGNLILGLETSDELASFYGGQEILTKALLPPEKIIDRMNKVTAAEVRSVARAIFKSKGLNLAIIGPYRNRAMFEKNLMV
ncbi:MAG: pitrilysin family protein [Minisyncoccia bacterium]|jgi:predicted Zn-dependent peptidase